MSWQQPKETRQKAPQGNFSLTQMSKQGKRNKAETVREYA